MEQESPPHKYIRRKPPYLIAGAEWGMVGVMGLKQLYQDIYQKFLEQKERHKGYDFQHAPSGSIAPASTTFAEKVKPWTCNRPNRLQKIRADRDHQQQEILRLQSPPTSKR